MISFFSPGSTVPPHGSITNLPIVVLPLGGGFEPAADAALGPAAGYTSVDGASAAPGPRGCVPGRLVPGRDAAGEPAAAAVTAPSSAAGSSSAGGAITPVAMASASQRAASSRRPRRPPRGIRAR